MKINILTLFPEMFDIFSHSIIGRAKEKKLVEINPINIRDFTLNKHKKVDDYPYGGGAGMVMTPQPLVDSIKHCRKNNKGKVIFLGPRGKTFNQELAKELSKEEELIFVCGHYEGIDERVYNYIDLEISLGDFILTGGEMAAIPIIDSILRLKEGVLGKSESFQEESFSDGLLEYPQYTRPEIFEGQHVPEVLLSGHHENIRKWRRLKSLEITKEKRPDLYKQIKLSKEDLKLLKNKK
jgi:tRNA (guanine37-N1)-methyltransferase